MGVVQLCLEACGQQYKQAKPSALTLSPRRPQNVRSWAWFSSPSKPVDRNLHGIPGVLNASDYSISAPVVGDWRRNCQNYQPSNPSVSEQAVLSVSDSFEFDRSLG